MKTVWIVYSHFTDDPSVVRGIFETEDEARDCLEDWDDNYKDIQEIELNKIFEKEIVLN